MAPWQIIAAVGSVVVRCIFHGVLSALCAQLGLLHVGGDALRGPAVCSLRSVLVSVFDLCCACLLIVPSLSPLDRYGKIPNGLRLNVVRRMRSRTTLVESD